MFVLFPDCFSVTMHDIHHSWTWSWLAQLAVEWLKYVQSGQCAAAEKDSLCLGVA